MAVANIVRDIDNIIDYVQTSPLGGSVGQNGGNYADGGDEKHLRLNTGALMPILGLGTWLSDKGLVQKAVEYAIDIGYRHFDCAWIYRNEEEVGEALTNKFREGVVKREDVFVTSKLWNQFHHPKDVLPHLKDSLKKLQLDYLDLYLIHWPFAMQFDEKVGVPRNEKGDILFDDVHFTDTWKAMEELVDAGLVKAIGLSNFAPWQIEQILKVCRIRPAVDQVEVHPYLNMNHYLDYCRKQDIVLTGYSPLGNPGRPEGMLRALNAFEMNDPILKELSEKYNKSVAQIMIKWQAQRRTIVIPKSVKPHRIQENGDIWDFTISDADMKVIDRLNRNWRYCTMGGTETHEDFPFRDEKQLYNALLNRVRIPFIGLDTSSLLPQHTKQVVSDAIDIGYRLIDCLSYNDNEAQVGEAIRAKFGDGTITREDIFITAKLWNSHHHPNDVEAAIRESLDKLQVEQVDLYIMEHPIAFKRGAHASKSDLKIADGQIEFEFDTSISFEETFKAMQRLVDMNLTKTIGVANVNLDQLKQLLGLNLPHKVALVQNESHSHCQDDEMLQFCIENDIIYQATEVLNPTSLEADVIKQVAQQRNRSPEQVLLRWQLERGSCMLVSSEDKNDKEFLSKCFDIFGFQLMPHGRDFITKNIDNTDGVKRFRVIEEFKSHPQFPYAADY